MAIPKKEFNQYSTLTTSKGLNLRETLQYVRMSVCFKTKTTLDFLENLQS